MVLKDTLLYLAQNQKMRNFVVSNGLARGVARRFVAGETIEEAIQATHVLNQRGIQVALDYLGENVTDETEAKASMQAYLSALDLIKQGGASANISIKLTALGLDISQDLCEQQVHKILSEAEQRGIFVCIDMEGSAYTERTVDITLAMRKHYEMVGTVIQSYLYRSKDDVEAMIANNVRIRLVKGAYKEPSNLAFPDKHDVDKSYLQLMEMLLARGNFPAIASHDEAILNTATSFVRDQGIHKSSFEFQMLYGIRRDLQDKLEQQGYNMRVYVPYGSQWYPYLMRRMAERPANLMFVVTNALH